MTTQQVSHQQHNACNTVLKDTEEKVAVAFMKSRSRQPSTFSRTKESAGGGTRIFKNGRGLIGFVSTIKIPSMTWLSVYTRVYQQNPIFNFKEKNILFDPKRFLRRGDTRIQSDELNMTFSVK